MTLAANMLVLQLAATFITFMKYRKYRNLEYLFATYFFFFMFFRRLSGLAIRYDYIQQDFLAGFDQLYIPALITILCFFFSITLRDTKFSWKQISLRALWRRSSR